MAGDKAIWTAVGTMAVGLAVTMIGCSWFLATQMAEGQARTGELRQLVESNGTQFESELTGLRSVMQSLNDGRDRDLGNLEKRLNAEHDETLRTTSELREDVKRLDEKVNELVRQRRGEGRSPSLDDKILGIN